jgi:hypothetical protein
MAHCCDDSHLKNGRKCTLVGAINPGACDSTGVNRADPRALDFVKPAYAVNETIDVLSTELDH